MNKRYELLEPDDQPHVDDQDFGYASVLEVFTPAGTNLYAVDVVVNEEGGIRGYIKRKGSDPADLDEEEFLLVTEFSPDILYVLTARALFRKLNEADLLERAQESMRLQHTFTDWHNQVYHKDDPNYGPNFGTQG